MPLGVHIFGSDIVWSINPQRDRLRDLLQRMRRFATEVFTARNIELRCEMCNRQKGARI